MSMALNCVIIQVAIAINMLKLTLLTAASFALDICHAKSAPTIVAL